MDKITWENTKAVLEEYAVQIVKEYRNNLAQGVRNASKKLSDTLSTKVKVGETEISVELTMQDYWYYVEHGRKKGKMPPIKSIVEWIKIKPVIPRPFGKHKDRMPSPQALAWPIAKKIAREGTRGTHDLRNASDTTYHNLKSRLEEAIARDVENYVGYIFKEVF